VTTALLERVPPRRHRRGRGAGRAVRAAAHHLRRLQRLRRSLDFVEDFIRRAVLPRYANTHTESSGTGWQTTRLREDARRLIHQAVGGDERALVIFCGSGATAAVDKLVGLLGVAAGTPPGGARGRPRAAAGPHPAKGAAGGVRGTVRAPLQRAAALAVVAIGEDRDGGVDLAELETALACLGDRPLKIGSFSAASNVTGILTDTDRVARAAAPPPRVVVVGLHRRRPLRPHPHGRERPRPRRPQGRGVLLAAQVRRRPADPRRPGGPAGAGRRRGADRPRRRHDRVRLTVRSRAPAFWEIVWLVGYCAMV
jgi:hypothetical protein